MTLQEEVAKAIVVCAVEKNLALEPMPDEIAYELAQAVINCITEKLILFPAKCWD